MKKWLTCLLVLITLTGSFLPCCMDDDGCGEATTQTAGHAHGGEDDKGPCSPLFACGTCAAMVELHDPTLSLTAAPAIMVRHHTFYLMRLGTYSSSPFQPPRAC